MAKGIDYAACITAVVLFAISCYYLRQYSIHDAKANWKPASIFALYFFCPATLIYPFYIKIKTGKPIDLIHSKYKPLMNSVGLLVAGMSVPFIEQGYSYWAMLTSISAMGSAFFASLFLRPLSVDFGLVGMLCSFSFKLSYDRTHTSAAEWIRNFMACVFVICVKHLVDIESTDARQSVVPPHTQSGTIRLQFYLLLHEDSTLFLESPESLFLGSPELLFLFLCLW
ncbi:hypothetical protein AABB24_030411 [Solanum stoloniferum]|uniref:Uncharacterized protein n=1 Tax=Solanum stoloniferum TaxID=62892 RepID=A0ABD2S2W7_9SOLN